MNENDCSEKKVSRSGLKESFNPPTTSGTDHGRSKKLPLSDEKLFTCLPELILLTTLAEKWQNFR